MSLLTLKVAKHEIFKWFIHDMGFKNSDRMRSASVVDSLMGLKSCDTEI